MTFTDPFRRRPAALARLPRLIRLYIFNCLFGFLLSAIFCTLLLGLDVAGLRHLVLASPGGLLALGVFFVLNGIVFAGVQSAIVIWSLGQDETPPAGGKRLRAVPAPLPVRVAVERR